MAFVSSFQLKINNSSLLSSMSLIERVELLFNTSQPLASLVFPFSNVHRGSPKSSEKALEYKKCGNDLFCAGKFIEALKCYTQCAAVAPPNSPELAFAYANRSATLYRLESYEACLVDLNRALKENYPESSKPKLHDRRKNCLAKLRELKTNYLVTLKLVEPSILDDDTMHTNLRIQMKRCEFDPNATDMNYKDRFYLPEANLKNKTISNVSDKVSLKYSSEFGRHIVATKDIKPGELIAVEKPYASLLSLEKKYSHCANCFVKCQSLIPCPSCSSALYCSQSCLQNAFECFHHIECQILSLTGFPVEITLDWLIIRLLMVATKQGKEIEALMTHPIFKNPLKKPTGEFPDRFETTDYHNIQNLEDHLDKRDHSTLLRMVENVKAYMDLLKKTSFFDESRENKFSPKEKEKYLSHLLLKFVSCAFNAYGIREFYSNPAGHFPASSKNDAVLKIGSALYSFHSLFNHACDINVYPMFHKDVLVTHSIDHIKAGEQLFVSYGALYEAAAREVRQKDLREKYLFTCRCTPCEENWPLGGNLVSVKSEIIKYKELYQCWKSVEELYAPGVQKNQYSAKLFNLLCKFLTLMLKYIKRPKLNLEFYENQHRLMRMMMARGNYYEFLPDNVMYSL